MANDHGINFVLTEHDSYKEIIIHDNASVSAQYANKVTITRLRITLGRKDSCFLILVHQVKTAMERSCSIANNRNKLLF